MCMAQLSTGHGFRKRLIEKGRHWAGNPDTNVYYGAKNSMKTDEIRLQTEEMGKQIRTLFPAGSAFKPFVIFDERLDCIRVVARDCSVTEIRINTLLTVLEDN